MAIPDKLNLDGVEYPTSDFSEAVHKLLALRDKWNTELEEEKLKVAKTEQAVASLDNQLVILLNRELSQKKMDAEAPKE